MNNQHMNPNAGKSREAFGGVPRRRRRRIHEISKDNVRVLDDADAYAYADADADADAGAPIHHQNHSSPPKESINRSSTTRTRTAPIRSSYLYNYQTSKLLLPSLFFLFHHHDGDDDNSNNNLLIISLYCTLIVYITDLANWKEAFYQIPLYCVYGIAGFLCWDYIVHYDRHTLHYSSWNGATLRDEKLVFESSSVMESRCILIFSAWELITKVMLFYCLRCWSALQCKWLPKKDLHYMEQMLHFILPICFSSITSFSILQYMTYNTNATNNINYRTKLYYEDDDFMKEDNALSLAPIIFTLCFSYSVKLLCNMKSSFSIMPTDIKKRHTRPPSSASVRTTSNDNNDLEGTISHHERQIHQHENERTQKIFYQYFHTISLDLGCSLSRIGFIIPMLIWFLSYPIKQNHRKLFQMLVSSSDVAHKTAQPLFITILLDFILSVTLPFLSHSMYLEYGLWWKNIIHKNFTTWQWRFKMIEILAFIVAIEIIIHRYVIHLCIYIGQHVHRYHKRDEDKKFHSTFFISLLLNGGIIVLVVYHLCQGQLKGFSIFKNLDRNGIPHGKDLYLLVTILVSSFCFGWALALPWYSMLYFISTAVFLALYQALGKIQFGVVSIFNAILTTSSLLLRLSDVFDNYFWTINLFHVALFVLTSARPSILSSEVDQIGNQVASLTHRIGTHFSIFSFCFFIMEILLIREFKMVDVSIMVRLSSISFIAFAVFLFRWRLLNTTKLLVSVSFSVSKLIISVLEGSWRHVDGATGRLHLLIHSSLISLFLFCVGLPFLPMNPFSQKRDTNTYRFNKKQNAVDKSVLRIITLYCGLLLPALILHFTSTMKQMIEVLLGVNSQSQTHQLHDFLLIEVWGYSIWIWGTLVTLVLHHNFPEGGAEKWKRLAFASFLIGLLICYITPTFILSRSLELIRTKQLISPLFSILTPVNLIKVSYTGIIGLLVHAVLLWNFRFPQWIHVNGKYSFSAFNKRVTIPVFGFAVSVFGLIAFLVNNFATFHESVYLFSVSMLAIAMCYGGFVADKEYPCIFFGLATSFFLGNMISASGSCMTLFSFLCVMNCLSLSFMGRLLRRKRTMETRSFANISILASWAALIVAVHKEFGIAGIGVHVSQYSYIVGCPVSTICIVLFSLIFLLVEGESDSRRKPLRGTLRFHHQHRHRYLFIPISLTQGLITFYVIFLRGFYSYLINGLIKDGYEDVFESNFGSESRTTYNFESNSTPVAYSVHDMSVQITSKLAASGFWTSTNYCGSIKHSVGFIITVYSWYTIFKCKNPAEVWNALLMVVPLIIFPICFCNGIPSLTMSCYTWVILICFESISV